MGILEHVLRLTAAAVLGGLIGLERHRSDKAAGVRTHMLVSVGSALIMIVSAHGFDQVLQPGRVVLDPSRVAAQVVSGIGFLGAGTILRRNTEVFGLTTAASIWAVAAVGLAAGGGLYLAASLSTALILVVLAVIRPLEDRLGNRGGRRALFVHVQPEEFALSDLVAALRRFDLEFLGVQSRRVEPSGEQRLAVTISRATDDKLVALVEHLHTANGVREVDSPGHSQG